MYLTKQMKNILKIASIFIFVLVLTGCTINIEDGQLIADRAINLDTAWSLSAGIFDFILVIPLAKAIILLGNLFGNIAAGVVLVTIFVNILILPIMIKSTISSQKMQMLQPEMEKIRNKYRGKNDQATQIRMNQEVQELYRKNDVSMLGSFSTFLTLPIVIAMWQAVQRIEVLYETTLFGINLGLTPLSQIFEGKYIYLLLPILVGLAQFMSMEMTMIMQKRNPKYQQSKQTNQFKTMNRFMTVMIVYMAASMPSAMSLYWITSSLINIARTYYIQIHHIEKERHSNK